MSRIAYFDGQYVPIDHPAVQIEDRGYQFGDGIYEVIALRNGKLFDVNLHLNRMQRSLAEVDMPMPVSRAVLDLIIAETVRRNRLRNGAIYIQISRGVARRDQNYNPDIRPILVVTVRPTSITKRQHLLTHGVRVRTYPDLRWGRCDIKTISLIANVMARAQARREGADEAWFYDGDGFVTEAAVANAWICDREGILRTQPEGPSILGGITRQVVLAVADSLNLKVDLRPFTVQEALTARECFATSSTMLISPVVTIDDQPIGNGQVGEIAQALSAHYDIISEQLASSDSRH